jgi:hypothetical protein
MENFLISANDFTREFNKIQEKIMKTASWINNLVTLRGQLMA